MQSLSTSLSKTHESDDMGRVLTAMLTCRSRRKNALSTGSSSDASMQSLSTSLSKTHESDDMGRVLTAMLTCRSRRKNALSTGSSSDASMQSLLSSLDALRPGSLFMDKYLVERGARRGAHTALIFGQDKDDPSNEVRSSVQSQDPFKAAQGQGQTDNTQGLCTAPRCAVHGQAPGRAQRAQGSSHCPHLQPRQGRCPQ